MTPSLPSTLFVGKGGGAVTTWYRCALPAMALGCEWYGAVLDPPDIQQTTGMSPRRLAYKNLFDYEVLVLQQPVGPAWIKAIRELQAAGITVLFEIDDYVRAIRKMEDHDFAGHFGKDQVDAYELSMAVCDGLIVSTEFLARRYRAFNENVWICRNGLDLKRYALTRPPHEQVTIGWAGGTGHREALRPWLDVVAGLMRERPEICLLTIGAQSVKEFIAEFGEERALALPFSDIYTYPAAMAGFDITLAPAGKGNFFRGKSDLRWLESSALGIPAVADPSVYGDIEHGVTGLHAATPAEAREMLETLVSDAGLRTAIGAAAQAHVAEHRSIQATAPSWATAIIEASGGTVAPGAFETVSAVQS
jgi:glycosyltransferase involved in cell wall biosynthesis